jgi:hypothetical protein
MTRAIDSAASVPADSRTMIFSNFDFCLDPVTSAAAPARQAKQGDIVSQSDHRQGPSVDWAFPERGRVRIRAARNWRPLTIFDMD